MLRRASRLLGSTNRYTDGSGRALDSNFIPRGLYDQTISNRAYPVRGENWQPVVAGKPSPHKGSVIISGAGVIGLTLSAQFALRGWHATVIECSPPLQSVKDEPMPAASTETLDPSVSPTASPLPLFLQPYRGPLVRPHFGAASARSSSGSTGNRDADGSAAVSSPSSLAEPSPPSRFSPFIELQYALVTRRALDALEVAGVRLHAIRHLGVKVRGVMDHPGAYNSWISTGLTEHHPFAVNMLSMDLFQLRRLLERHVADRLPSENLQVFYEHVIDAVYPLRQQLVVRPWEISGVAKQWAATESSVSSATSSASEVDRTAQIVAEALRPRRKLHTSLTISSRQWEKKFAHDAVSYDLLVSAEGVNSHLRDLMDVEGFAADVDMGVRWCLLRSEQLSHEHVHRWLHRRRTAAITSAHSYHVQTAHQVPLTLAFPRVEGSNLFSVMVYAPRGELAGLDDVEMLRHYLPDLASSSSSSLAAELRSFSADAQPYPTVYCEQLHNTVGLPSAVLVGDAAHTCNPFWMQSLALGLEDGASLLNQVEAYSRHFYDAVKQYSDERGSGGDALRELTDRCLYYERRKHVNPLLRLRNWYQHFMNVYLPRRWNTLYEGSVNHLYSRSIEDMLNSRGYTSYDYAEKQQVKHRRFYHFGRLYT
ncbi:hypothetical protein LSCM1_06910 [Leishmania martiniquensis]|uniref:Flavoprotein monooxygenase n=1 Tax=Leishmania martiniquensis TaxID=1580590 RepID=A0A836HRH9_9TRYP|nr:hypothetical protein LSCM1_06910 [Leishmania martiniquensis]